MRAAVLANHVFRGGNWTEDHRLHVLLSTNLFMKQIETLSLFKCLNNEWRQIPVKSHSEAVTWLSQFPSCNSGVDNLQSWMRTKRRQGEILEHFHFALVFEVLRLHMDCLEAVCTWTIYSVANWTIITWLSAHRQPTLKSEIAQHASPSQAKCIYIFSQITHESI